MGGRREKGSSPLDLYSYLGSLRASGITDFKVFTNSIRVPCNCGGGDGEDGEDRGDGEDGGDGGDGGDRGDGGDGGDRGDGGDGGDGEDEGGGGDGGDRGDGEDGGDEGDGGDGGDGRDGEDGGDGGIVAMWWKNSVWMEENGGRLVKENGKVVKKGRKNY